MRIGDSKPKVPHSQWGSYLEPESLAPILRRCTMSVALHLLALRRLAEGVTESPISRPRRPGRSFFLFPVTPLSRSIFAPVF